jgi:hypothetical protein
MLYKVEKDYINPQYRKEWINELKIGDVVMQYQNHIFILPTINTSGRTTCLPDIILTYHKWDIPPKNEVLYLHELNIYDKIKIYNHLPTGKQYPNMINIKSKIYFEIERYHMENPSVLFDEEY